MAARLDRAKVGKEIGGAAQPVERVAAPVIRRDVNALGDVLPITLDQLPQIPDQPLPVGRFAAAQFLGHRQRLRKARRKQFLAEKPTDPRNLRGFEGELVEGVRHHAMRYGVGAALQYSSIPSGETGEGDGAV